MRGIAAVAVCLYHTHTILAESRHGGLDVWAPFANAGWLGVNFFFVLSGFILFYAHREDLGHPGRLSSYLTKRFVRLYPIYWVCLASFIFAAQLGIGNPEINWNPAHLFAAFSLLLTVDHPVLPLKVAWTLIFEVKFYLIFSVFFFSVRAGVAVFVLWGLLVVVRSFYSPPSDWAMISPDWGMLSAWNIYFLVGALAYLIHSKVQRRAGGVLLVTGVCLILLVLMFPNSDMGSANENPRMLIYFAPGFLFLILGAIAVEESYVIENFPRCLVLVGDASYSIYLVHSAIISLLASLQYKYAPGMIPDQAIFSLIFLSSVVAGILVHIAIERPLLSLLRRKRSPASVRS